MYNILSAFVTVYVTGTRPRRIIVFSLPKTSDRTVVSVRHDYYFLFFLFGLVKTVLCFYVHSLIIIPFNRVEI